MANPISSHQEDITPRVTAARQRIGVAPLEFGENPKLREDHPALPEPRPTKSSFSYHVDR